MQLIAAFLLGLVATMATAQGITLTPTTIRGPTRPAECPLTVTATVIETTKVEVTKTEISVKTLTSVVTSVRTSVSTATATVRQTVTSVNTVRQTVTSVNTVTTTRPCQPNGGNCPTLTSTVSPCPTCLVPDCTEIVQVTRPCNCVGALPTTTVNLDCNIDGVCQRIGCKTVYDVKTAMCN